MTHFSEVTDSDEFLLSQHYVLQIPFPIIYLDCVPKTLNFYVHTNKFSNFIDVNFTIWFSRCKDIIKTSLAAHQINVDYFILFGTSTSTY